MRTNAEIPTDNPRILIRVNILFFLRCRNAILILLSIKILLAKNCCNDVLVDGNECNTLTKRFKEPKNAEPVHAEDAEPIISRSALLR